MPTINKRVEAIFAHAVALQQDGRFRSTIYGRKRQVFILNQDATALLRFRLRKGEVEFKNPITFRANDYDSCDLREEKGSIFFEQRNADFERTKKCSVPKEAQEDVEALWEKVPKSTDNKITLSDSIFELLDLDLSHIEFNGEEGVFIARQRNIFDGSVIDVRKKSKKGGGLLGTDTVKDFGPVAVRTNDFRALFSFCTSIDFHFADTGFVYFNSVDPRWKMDGVISQCLYDEMKGDSDGRKKSKKRGCK